MTDTFTSFADTCNRKSFADMQSPKKGLEPVINFSDNSPMNIGSRIAIARKRLGITQAQLADAVGASQSAVGNWESNLNSPSRTRITKIADTLKVSPYWIEFGGSNDQLREPPSPDFAVMDKNVITGALQILGAPSDDDENGVIMNSSECFGTTGRPAALDDVRDAYAAYVVGDAMEPRYFNGEILHINPHKPVTKGCFVLVQLKPEEDGDRPSYIVKQLQRRNASEVVLKQYRPSKEIRIPSSKVLAVHRIVGSAEH